MSEWFWHNLSAVLSESLSPRSEPRSVCLQQPVTASSHQPAVPAAFPLCSQAFLLVHTRTRVSLPAFYARKDLNPLERSQCQSPQLWHSTNAKRLSPFRFGCRCWKAEECEKNHLFEVIWDHYPEPFEHAWSCVSITACGFLANQYAWIKLAWERLLIYYLSCCCIFRLYFF